MGIVAVVYILIGVCLAVFLLVVSLCMLSSRISRFEERNYYEEPREG